MAKVSVIVPVYNVERYLERCLESLVYQTLEDIEIMIVNDGSKDNSEQIAKKIMKKFPSKIIYLEKENGGLSDARNYALPYAKGEYIAFLDSDDYVEKDMYEKMYQLAEKENSDMVECDFFWEYPDQQKKDIGELYQGKAEMIEKVRVVAWNKLIKRKVLEKAKIKFPKGYQYEDVEFTYKLIPYLEKVSFLKEPCIHYVQRDGSIANSQNERTREIFDVLENVIKFYQEKGIYEKYQTQLEYIYIRYAFCSSFLRMVKVPNKNVRKMLLRETWEKVHQKFPNWRKNVILKTTKNSKNIYMRTINKITYKIYEIIFRRMK